MTGSRFQKIRGVLRRNPPSNLHAPRPGGQGKLRLIPVAGYEGTIQFGYVSARQEPLSGQARAFVDHVAGAVETARGGRIREL